MKTEFLTHKQVSPFLGLPARLHAEEAAKVLGFEPHDIPLLIASKFLKPLGSPAPNAPKYFAAMVILELAQNPEWLDRATKTISKHWKVKNSRKNHPETSSSEISPNQTLRAT